jgi:hypothetical protein
MHKKKILLLGTMLLAAVLVLSGCKSAEEKAAEKLIESGTNGQADVDIGTNSVKINTNAGSYQAGGNVTLPSGFPSDVYIIDGTLTSAQTNTATSGYIVSIETTKTVTEAKDLYDRHIVSDGWTLNSSMVYEGSALIYGSKGNRTLQIGINTGSTGTIVAVTTFTNTSANTNSLDTPQ